MSSPAVLVTSLIAVFWTWRVFSFFYSSYAITDAVTPASTGAGVKALLTSLQIAVSIIMNLLPTFDYPRLSLANRILSVPSQAYTVYFANRYIGPTIDSKRVTIFLYVVSLLSILDTMYKISLDWDRIE